MGHSYFSYVAALEYQRRNVVHFHTLFDEPTDYQAIHGIWDQLSGFSWLTPVGDKVKVVEYVTKYVTKGGDLEIYKKIRHFEPISKPHWWK